MSGLDSIDLKSNEVRRKGGSSSAQNQKVKVRVSCGSKPIWISKAGKEIFFNKNQKVSYVIQSFLDNHFSDTKKVEQVSLYGKNGPIHPEDPLSKHAAFLHPSNCYVMIVSLKYILGGGMYMESKMTKLISKSSEEKERKNEKEESKKNDVSQPRSETVVFSIKAEPKYRERNIKKSNKHKYSNERCIISLEKDKNNNVYMPCNHTINSQSMFMHLLSSFNSNNWQTDVFCPVPLCKKKWNFEYCAQVACLNVDEWIAFETEIVNRKKGPSKPCPNCKVDCEKPPSVQYYRVACVCQGGDWCWDCGKKWIGGGFTVCGNKGCTTNDINDMLKNCGTKVICTNITVPALRACPFCHCVVAHGYDCKHMNCKGCGKDFCYVCLKGKNAKGQWLCKVKESVVEDSEYNCGVHPIQVLK